jgi:hypothetical protein
MKLLYSSFVLCFVGCGGASAFEERAVSPTSRRPLIAERVAMPGSVPAVAAWVGPQGDGLVALYDGRIVAIDADGAVASLDRIAGETPRADEAPVTAFVDRAPGRPMALVPGGALVVERGVVRRVALPLFLAQPRAFAPLGNEALWATPSGMYASRGAKWIGLEGNRAQGTPGPTLDATALFAIDGLAREAWVLAGATLERVRVDETAGAPRVTWIEGAPGVDLGAVKMAARVDGARVAVVGSRGVTIVAPDRIRAFQGEPEDGQPLALGAGGGWAWVAWAGQVLRTDGEKWESLASGLALNASSRIAVDGGTGAAAILIDAAGNVLYFEAEDTLRSSGIDEGAVVLDTRAELEMIPPRAARVASLAFTLDGKPLASRTQPPWGWGTEGARAIDLSSIGFGPHRVDVGAKYADGRTLARTIHFTYASPLGRVPTYDRDIAPLYAAHCARCHGNGVAHDLDGYDALSGEAGAARKAVREGRMPPDILLDPVSVEVFTAWADGDAPR